MVVATSASPSSMYGYFGGVRELRHYADCGEARALLLKLATDYGIVQTMRKYGWRVGMLSEMEPEGLVGVDPVCVLGLNVNAGQEIKLRLRTDDLSGFRYYKTIKKVLCHELAHNVHSNHDHKFLELESLINKEAHRLDWSNAPKLGGGGGNRVGEVTHKGARNPLWQTPRANARYHDSDSGNGTDTSIIDASSHRDNDQRIRLPKKDKEAMKKRKQRERQNMLDIVHKHRQQREHVVNENENDAETNDMGSNNPSFSSCNNDSDHNNIHHSKNDVLVKIRDARGAKILAQRTTNTLNNKKSLHGDQMNNVTRNDSEKTTNTESLDGGKMNGGSHNNSDYEGQDVSRNHDDDECMVQEKCNSNPSMEHQPAVCDAAEENDEALNSDECCDDDTLQTQNDSGEDPAVERMCKLRRLIKDLRHQTQSHDNNQTKNNPTFCSCVTLLHRYVNNPILNDSEEKFRRIRTTNKHFQAKIQPFPAARAILSCVGFYPDYGSRSAIAGDGGYATTNAGNVQSEFLRLRSLDVGLLWMARQVLMDTTCVPV